MSAERFICILLKPRTENRSGSSLTKNLLNFELLIKQISITYNQTTATYHNKLMFRSLNIKQACRLTNIYLNASPKFLVETDTRKTNNALASRSPFSYIRFSYSSG